jgi:hypothetical protein
MSELLDALPDESGHPRPSGTYAQSWSVAEFSRNAYQDYLGFRPNLLRNTLALVPALPEDWHTLSARLPFGRSESLQLQVRREGAAWVWQFAALSGSARRIELDLLTDDNGRRRLAFELGAQPRTLRWDGRVAALDGLVLDSQPVMQSQQAMLQGLDLATPPPPSTAFPMLRGRDVLRAIVSGDQSR